jgi:predicted metalloendopeptidase
MEALVRNLREAFSTGIDELEWMGPQTRQQAKAKLAKLDTRIGFPTSWRDYSGLEIARGDLVGNVLRSAAFEYRRMTAKLGQPVDRAEWIIPPYTVDAFAVRSQIVFPAGILQPPFFDPEADDAVNYGAIGAVIGHEISHHFDDGGRKFDADGNLRDWWTADDAAAFEARAARLVERYGSFQPIAGLHVDGKLTLGENIGDLSGLAVAYRAYRLSLGGREAPVIGELTGDQRFFLGFARIWCAKYRDEELRRTLLTDPHSPPRYRVNGVVANMSAFYQAFDVKPGDGMYLPVEQRVKIW